MNKNKGKKCSVHECDKLAFCKGYCSKHYQQIKFHGKITEKEAALSISQFCKNLGCGQPVFVKGLCQNCYAKQRLFKN
jgi:hypothetical protein